MPARNPQAVHQRTIAAARRRSGRPPPAWTRCLWPSTPAPSRPGNGRRRAARGVRRDEEYAILGANVVVELNRESRARKPTTRAWAIIRRAERSHRLASQRQSRADRHHIDRASRADRTSRSQQPEARGMVADAR